MKTLLLCCLLTASAFAASAPYAPVKDPSSGKITAVNVIDTKTNKPMYSFGPADAEWPKFVTWNAANGSPYDTSKILTPKTEAELFADIQALSAADRQALESALLARAVRLDPTLISAAGLSGKLSDTK